MPFELHIALRYLRSRRISLASTLGVAVGVMALVVALALMTGLQAELRDRILGSTAHVFVFKQKGITDYRAEIEQLRKIPGVTGAAPAIIGRAIVRSAGSDAFISFKGIDPVLEPSVTELEKSIVAGKLSDLLPQEGNTFDGIFLGQDVANSLGVQVGDSVTLMTPEGVVLNPFSGIAVRTPTLRVVGIFRLGLYEYDAAYGFVSLGVAQRLLNRSQPELIELKVADIYSAPDVASSISATLGSGYLTQDWTMMNRALFNALWMEKMAISIAIGLIVLVAALNIVASLVLLVIEKRPDIAILKTMGASARAAMLIFMLQGLVIGILGTLIGSTLGIVLSWLLDRYRLVRVPGDVYQISYVPFTLLPLDLVVVVILAIFVCFVATIYPSRQAARLRPVEALRYR